MAIDSMLTQEFFAVVYIPLRIRFRITGKDLL